MWKLVLPAFLRSASSSADLHCCFAPLNQPVVLACDQFSGDFISDVPFAFFGNVLPENRVCGADNVTTGGVQIEGHLSTACTGKRVCTIQWSEFSSLCSSCSELLLRWVCHSDSARHKSMSVSALRGPLRAQGNVLVNTLGQRVRLQGLNWPGMHITHVPFGLDRSPLLSIALRIRSLGFNVVRLTWDVNTVLSNPVVSTRLVAANPRLVGMRALEVMEEVFKALEQVGLAVWLDNHMLETDWCCSSNDCNGLWFNQDFSEEDWLEAWRTMARRSRPYPAVVGAGLKNEVRAVTTGLSWGQGAFCNASALDPRSPSELQNAVAPSWDSGPAQLQWLKAAERAGHAVLSENPSLVVSISGLDFATDLREAKNHLPNLPRDKFAFEGHSYSWQYFTRVDNVAIPGQLSGPFPAEEAKNRCKDLGTSCGGVTCTSEDSCELRSGQGSGPTRGATEARGQFSHVRRFEWDLSDFANRTDQWWGYLSKQGIAPVLVSEFGMATSWQADASASRWFEQLSKYIADLPGGFDWMYWTLNGEQSGGTSRHAGDTESFGVLNHCMTAPAGAAHIEALQSLMTERELLI
ncbi:unnamed protein product [Effrenium voratum]|uniref:Glycoside hydrolase family 5 domain-containing protein n=1 Tax=Effrenium voratum TaxID=2562239 RepID=A0AA36J075_9DINO|nr:unnamed protein product [Effrenium voratum]